VRTILIDGPMQGKVVDIDSPQFVALAVPANPWSPVFETVVYHVETLKVFGEYLRVGVSSPHRATWELSAFETLLTRHAKQAVFSP
jgi:hypothetical protein